MSLDLNQVFDSDDEEDCDYVPSKKELQEAEKELSFLKDSKTPEEDTKETAPAPDPVEEKKKAEDIWKEFLSVPENPPKRDKSDLKDIDSSGPSKVAEEDKVSGDVKLNIQNPLDEKNENSKPPLKRKGLSSVFETLKSKKSKQTVLQKSLSDWNEFKQEEGIEEDLRTYNKGKGGYLNRKSFLERADIRSYEVERDLRLSKK